MTNAPPLEPLTTAETLRPTSPSLTTSHPHTPHLPFSRPLPPSTAPLFLTLIAALVTLLTFRGGLPIGYGDGGLGQFLYDPNHWLSDSFYAWDPSINLGGAYGISPATTALLPLTATWTALTRLGVPPGTVEALYIFAVIASALLFSFYAIRGALAASALERHTSAPLAAPFIGSIAAVFNLYSATTYWRLFDLNIALIALAPFCLWAINLAFDKTPIARLTFYIAAGLVLLSPAFGNLAYLPPIALLAITYALWRTAVAHGPTRRSWLRLAAATTFAIVVNASIYVPAITASLTAYSARTANLLSNSTVLSVSSADANIWNVLRGMVVSPASALWQGKNPAWRYFYSTPLGMALGVLLLTITVAGLTERTTRRSAAYGLLIFVLGAFGAMGSTGLTGGLFAWCFTHVPGFTLLRIPYLALAPFLTTGFAFAIATGTAATLSHWRAFKASLSSRHCLTRRGIMWPGTDCAIVTLVLSLLLGYTFPLTLGTELRQPITIHGPTVTSTIKVPPTYSAVRKYLTSHNTVPSRVLALPLSASTDIALNWRHGYDGPDDAYLLLNAPTIAFLSSGVDPWQQDFIQALEASALPSLIKTAGLLGCGYVLLQANALADVYAGPGGNQQLSLAAEPDAVAAFIKTGEAALEHLGAREVLVAGPLSLYVLI